MTHWVVVEQDGSVQVPAALVAEMGLIEGTDLTLELVDGIIVVRRNNEASALDPV